MEDRNLFHRVDTIGNIFTSGAATNEIITDGVHEMKYKFRFMLLTLSGRSLIKIQYSSFPLFPGTGTSVRSRNIFTYISRYPTGKHEIIQVLFPTRLFPRISDSYCDRYRSFLIKEYYLDHVNVGKQPVPGKRIVWST